MLMECCSILCFLNEASFPCMQMSCCRQLILHEAVFYFGDRKPWDLFNRPLSLSMDWLAPNFSAGCVEEKLERLIWTPRLHIHQGWLRSAASAGPRTPSEEKGPWRLRCPVPGTTVSTEDVGTCLPLVMQGGIRGKEIFRLLLMSKAIRCFWHECCEVGNYFAGLWC